VAGDLMVVVNHEGLVRTLRLGANGALAGAGQLGPGVLASPAIADGAIYFRDRTHLWRIAKTNP
jgi:hypothetical protein